MFKRNAPEHEEPQGQYDSDDLLSSFDAPLISDQPQEAYEFAFESVFSTNLIIKYLTPATSEVVFWAETSEWKKEPDLVFRKGAKDGPVAGSGIMRKRNHEMTFRIGGNGTVEDHSVGNELATVNQDKKWRDSAYTLAIPTTSAHAPRLYHFTRTQSTKDGVQGIAAKLAYYNWIVSNVRKEKVGLYLENPKNGISLTRGKMTLNPDTLDEPGDLLVLLLGLVAINERARRDLNLTIAIT